MDVFQLCRLQNPRYFNKVFIYLYENSERQAFSLTQTESQSSESRLIENTMCLSVV